MVFQMRSRIFKTKEVRLINQKFFMKLLTTPARFWYENFRVGLQECSICLNEIQHYILTHHSPRCRGSVSGLSSLGFHLKTPPFLGQNLTESCKIAGTFNILRVIIPGLRVFSPHGRNSPSQTVLVWLPPAVSNTFFRAPSFDSCLRLSGI